ncbi:hypothetical protein [Streptomyces rhizosphaericola]|uniref:Uncharacterized protein n=1 Tax=Streptomyces rhizosphaericola TaxID=2564098 RepID=A0ABY2PEA2_9ACTN|nr:hypothetical protein E5Z02_16760 [Streptomyces rhizosphaericola]
MNHHGAPALDALAAHQDRGELGSPHPAVLPGERITDPLRAYPRSGGAAGMNAAGPKPLTGKCP